MIETQKMEAFEPSYQYYIYVTNKKFPIQGWQLYSQSSRNSLPLRYLKLCMTFWNISIVQIRSTRIPKPKILAPTLPRIDTGHVGHAKIEISQRIRTRIFLSPIQVIQSLIDIWHFFYELVFIYEGVQMPPFLVPPSCLYF